MPSLVDETGALRQPYSNFIAISRYARWRDEDMRRETWAETADRYIEFFRGHLSQFGVSPVDPMFRTVHHAITNLEVMPSMRALMTAGPALQRSHVAGYNCSFIAVDDPRAFDEAMYVLLNGTGVGYSVEARHVDQLPPVAPVLETTDDVVILVPDSKEGWAQAFRHLLSCLWQGVIPLWDLSEVRPAGARLKTFGGRASGPAPLDSLFRYSVDMFVHAAGRRLTPLECHDLMCKVGDIVVSGGVRRSALISLSDLGNHDMAKAKNGNWWEHAPHRALANNSAAYQSKPSVTQFLREWRNLVESQSGERGILNLEGARMHANFQGRDGSLIEGTNPCAEILLRSDEFCNLSEVVIRAEDNEDDVLRKVSIAAVIGTWQSTLIEFPYLRPEWRKNCEEERLLGVSLTGIYGNMLFNNPNDPRLPGRLARMRSVAHLVNEQWADTLGINPSAAITCVKPSGTVSQLVGVSSGIHPWHSRYYTRTVRGAINDPMSELLKDWGVPCEPDAMKPDANLVFSFPISAPRGAVTRSQITALEHLALWSVYRDNWTDHNPSITVNVRDHEWLDVGAWVYRNWDRVGGISFLPYADHTYVQAPYQAITEDEYLKAAADFPTIRWADLGLYELLDSTTGTRELACSADGSGCDAVDLAGV